MVGAYLAANRFRSRLGLDYWTELLLVAAVIVVPLVAVLVALDRSVARPRVREELRRRGRRQSCGYDLRVTPGRCPECGKAAAEA